jgi:hypothetical protein
MTLVLDATVGGAAANSYADQASANSYFEGRRNADAWTAASSTAGGERDQALVAACARLEQEAYAGYRSTLTQALRWPRRYVVDPDPPVGGTALDTSPVGYYLSDAQVPVAVKRAQYELALHLLNYGATDPLAPTGLEQFDSLSVGAIDLTPAAQVAGALPPQVLRLLRPLLLSAPGTVRLRRA